ncbi:hypothetical protein V2A60_007675 [Cordyceps javanica]|uniref:Uncharacterized protein n=1 Tax=Cordyceps javanica TaxID=43265 RepID=A0A545W7I3_9HYPO|nr:hypothetical protein IF1G_02683 [Cordyceps javanica]TQW09815.1 hypothetical protein IF2G_02605 [Cordyceps javanica]
MNEEYGCPGHDPSMLHPKRDTDPQELARLPRGPATALVWPSETTSGEPGSAYTHGESMEISGSAYTHGESMEIYGNAEQEPVGGSSTVAGATNHTSARYTTARDNRPTRPTPAIRGASAMPTGSRVSKERRRANVRDTGRRQPYTRLHEGSRLAAQLQHRLQLPTMTPPPLALPQDTANHLPAYWAQAHPVPTQPDHHLLHPAGFTHQRVNPLDRYFPGRPSLGMHSHQQAPGFPQSEAAFPQVAPSVGGHGQASLPAPWLNAQAQYWPESWYAAPRGSEDLAATTAPDTWGVVEVSAPETAGAAELEATQQQEAVPQEPRSMRLPAEELSDLFGFLPESLIEEESVPLELLGGEFDYGAADLDAGVSNGIQTAATTSDQPQMHYGEPIGAADEFNFDEFNFDQFNSEEFNFDEFNVDQFNSEEFNFEEFNVDQYFAPDDHAELWPETSLEDLEFLMNPHGSLDDFDIS